MVRHIVAWKLKESFSEVERKEHAQAIQNKLEALPAVIEGIVSLKVIQNLLPSSSMDLMLDSTFVDQAALDAYQIHPEHKKVSAYVAEVRQERVCLDYEV